MKEWLDRHEEEDLNGNEFHYVDNLADFENVDPEDTEYLMGKCNLSNVILIHLNQKSRVKQAIDRTLYKKKLSWIKDFKNQIFHLKEIHKQQ